MVSVAHASVMKDVVESAAQTLSLTTTSKPSKRANLLIHGMVETGYYDEMVCKLEADQKINKIPGGRKASKKHKIASSFDRIRSLAFFQDVVCPLEEIWPETLVLPKDRSKVQALLEKNKRRKGKKKRTYILKPSSGSQGEGILLLRYPSDLRATTFLTTSNRKYVLQRYLEPHIIPSYPYKFDLRIFVTVTSIEPFELFLHKEGLVRFCTSTYKCPTDSNLHDVMAHLTNYSLNMRAENYTVGESKRPLTELIAMDDGLPLHMSGEDLYDKLGTLAFYTLSAIVPELKTNKATILNPILLTNSYQTFGLDVLISPDGDCSLLEVNASPSMKLDHEGESSKVDCDVKLSVMSDVLRIAIGLEPENCINLSDLIPSSTWAQFQDLFDNVAKIYAKVFPVRSDKLATLSLIKFRKLVTALGYADQNARFDLIHQRITMKLRDERDWEEDGEFGVADLWDVICEICKEARMETHDGLKMLTSNLIT